jgi:hypothetical protein
MLGLCHDDLDTNEPAARLAAHDLGRITRRFLFWLDTLDEASTLLADSRHTSTRATTAHHHIHEAQQLAETIINNLTEAKDALEFHWPRPTTPPPPQHPTAPPDPDDPALA